MRTVRRLYFYLVAFIGLEVVVWGVITLARTLLNQLPGGQVNLLAGGLALVLVGLPIFWLHWGVAQHDALKDEEERATRLRAVFLYGVRLAMLVPVLQNVIALITRPLLALTNTPSYRALVGGNQTLGDNLVALAVTLIVWAYFERVLRSDWAANPPGNSLADLRRLFRYTWLIYSLALLVGGVQQVLHFIFYFPEGLNNILAPNLANGIALTLASAPVWVWTGQIIASSLEKSEERFSTLRLVVLYFLALAGVITVLTSTGMVLAAALRWILGEAQTFVDFLNSNGAALAIAVPLGVIWAYYGRQLRQQISGEADPLRRASLARIYTYALSLMGNGAVFFGLWQLVSALVDSFFTLPVGSNSLRMQVSASLAALAVGLPLWLRNWPAAQAEAQDSGDLGEHARRSVVRKGYLYLALFVTVVGAMSAAGTLFYRLIQAILGSPGQNLVQDLAQRAQTLALVALWLVYHLRALQQDGRAAQQALAGRHASFPALVLYTAETGDFAAEFTQAMQRVASHLPVATQSIDQGVPGEEMQPARVVVLPSSLALEPPEALRLWLKEYSGQKIIVPVNVEGWVSLSTSIRNQREAAREAALAVRQLAEGQPVRPAPATGPWVIAGYVFGGLFALQLLFMLIMMGVSFFVR